VPGLRLDRRGVIGKMARRRAGGGRVQETVTKGNSSRTGPQREATVERIESAYEEVVINQVKKEQKCKDLGKKNELLKCNRMAKIREEDLNEVKKKN